MIFGLFGQKKGINKLRGEVQDSFNHVKKDISKIGDWIRIIDDHKITITPEVSEIKEQLQTIQEDIKSLKESLSFFGQTSAQTAINGHHAPLNKQTNNPNNQSIVQTTVQTFNIDSLSVMERAIIWSLLNSDMKLSYEDIATLLGKDKSTIRGQINAIKQKSPGIISELKENNGKKRLYIVEEVKKEITQRAKLRISQ
ncbi:MAG: hypothetical protein ACI83O_000078 [Patescibacteria group bacterium]|jgi:hypothetical protein